MYFEKKIRPLLPLPHLSERGSWIASNSILSDFKLRTHFNESFWHSEWYGHAGLNNVCYHYLKLNYRGTQVNLIKPCAIRVTQPPSGTFLGYYWEKLKSLQSQQFISYFFRATTVQHWWPHAISFTFLGFLLTNSICCCWSATSLPRKMNLKYSVDIDMGTKLCQLISKYNGSLQSCSALGSFKLNEKFNWNYGFSVTEEKKMWCWLNQRWNNLVTWSWITAMYIAMYRQHRTSTHKHAVMSRSLHPPPHKSVASAR